MVKTYRVTCWYQAVYNDITYPQDRLINVICICGSMGAASTAFDAPDISAAVKNIIMGL